MDIILKEDIENLGFRDELVTVKPGFARNFLIPQGKQLKSWINSIHLFKSV